MKKLLLFAAAALLVVSFAGAQSLTPSAHDIGIGASVSSQTSTVLGFYQLTNKIVLEPQVGIYHYNYADTAAGSTTNYPGTWYSLGASAYYTLKSFQRLSVQVGPAFTFASEKYQNQGSTNNFQLTYWSVAANLQILGMITQNLGVFTSTGFYYYSSDTKNTTLSTDTLQTGYGVQSVSLGVAYFLK